MGYRVHAAHRLLGLWYSAAGACRDCAHALLQLTALVTTTLSELQHHNTAIIHYCTAGNRMKLGNIMCEAW